VNVKSGFILTFLLYLVTLEGCHSPPNVLSDIATSHVEGNVPPGKLFDELLTRDLNDYFCRNSNDCKVQYELLRDGPTQSGTSYPKYYLWVRFTKGGTVAGEGAVRVAAIDQKSFEVTHFLSRELISQAPSQVASIFPAALVNKIVEKAHTSFNSQR